MVTPGPMHLTLPKDLADIVRARMAAGRFASAEDVLRSALALMAADQSGDNAATVRAKIEAGWQQAQTGQLTDGGVAMKRWRDRQDQRKPDQHG